MEKIDIAIVGGGVIGLSVAAAVAGNGKDVYIFEKNESFGQEISSRNSEVIHSGIYYPVWSLKKELCIEGNKLLYGICAEHGISHRKTGKLIVARDGSEIDTLEELFRKGRENGLEGIKFLAREEFRRIEPEVEGVEAIYLPMTGIIDSHSLMEHFLSRARAGGADIIYDAEVKSVDKEAGGGYRMTVSGKSGDPYSFLAEVVINCAGLNSDEVAAMAGIQDPGYVLSYCKGDYFRLASGKSRLIKGLVYPVSRPDDPSLGIHVTPDLAGGVRLGPDAEYLGSRKIDYNVDPGKKDLFFEDIRSFLPFLEKEDITADTSGIRPKLQGPGEGFRDFIIEHEERSGLRGFIDLVGIESPGLTAAPAIARKVAKMVDEYYGRN